MQKLNAKLLDTLEVFSDLQNLYAYKEDTRGVLKKMYENTLEVLNTPEIDISNLVDSNGDNLLHLASSSYNIEFFMKAASKGVNPYILNNNNRNAFQSRHYDFAANLWKNFEHIYFDNKFTTKSFELITNGFHKSFKQSIYENNIKNNVSQFNINELSQFLNHNDIYSHRNVLLFLLEKYNNTLTNLLDFVLNNQETFTPEDNSLALLCGLKYMNINNKQLESDMFFELFVDNNKFSIDVNFLQSMQYSANKYQKPSFQQIFHKQTQILIDNEYILEKKLDFYLAFKYTKDGKDYHSVHNLAELYYALSLEPVWNYYSIQKKTEFKTSLQKEKKLKL